MSQPFMGIGYGQEQDKILRRRALADALRQQSMEPMQASPGGRYVSAINPLQVIGKLAGMAVAKREQTGADKDSEAMTSRMRADSDKAFNDFQGEMAGTDPATGAKRKGDPLRAAAILAGSPNPMHQQLAASLMEQATRQKKYEWRDAGGELAQFDDEGNPTGKTMKKTAAPQAPDRTLVPVADPDSPTGIRYVTRAEADGLAAPGKGGAGGGGRPLPVTASKGILENSQNLRRAEQALALIQGQNVVDPKTGEVMAKGDADATGFKGYLPDIMLQRMDNSGIDTRAAIGDLGSLIVHDRSGAAVTAAEYPRLVPFIPRSSDDPATVKKKLTRFVQEYKNVINESAEFYKQSGYNVPTGALVGTATASPAADPNAAAGGKQVGDYFKKN